MDEILSDCGCPVLCEQGGSPSGADSEAKMEGESTLGRRNSRNKGPEAGIGLTWTCQGTEESLV